VLISENSPGMLLAGLISPKKNNPLLLVTGPRGSGKTLWCMKLAGLAQEQALCLRGLVSPSIFEGDEKTGIGLRDLQTGETRRLAYRKGAEYGDLPTQDWQMVAETLDWGNSILARVETCDLFILDEAGPFELENNTGLAAGLRIVDSARDFPCVVVVRPSLIQKAQARWSRAQVLDVSTEAHS